MDIAEHLVEVNELIHTELDSATEVTGKHLDYLKKVLNITWDPEPIYRTKQSIIFFDVNDYEAYKAQYPKAEDTLKLEMPYYNCYVYICQYMMSSPLYQLLEN